MKYIKLLLPVAVLVLSALACNLPGSTAPTPFVFPTPNLTMTAVFNLGPETGETVTSMPSVQSPTPTLGQPGSPSPTSLPPTETSIPPTETSVPPTETPVPTETPEPTVSYVGPSVRSGPSLTAYYLGQRPTLDGSFDDWFLDKYPVDNIVAGASNVSGSADLSARLMLGWDEDNLYVAARVKDDKYVQNASGDQIYKGDSLEILIDTDVSGDYYLRALDGDDFQLGISPGSPEPGDDPEAYLWFPQSREGERQKVKVGAMLVDDGYRIEAAIPWSTFGVTPRSGRHFGFAFSVSDNDKSGQNVQQSMVSNVATRVLTDPTSWGDLTLSSAGPQQRPGASVEAVYTSSAPTLDGDLSDWSLSNYSVDNVVYGKDQWTGASDLSGNLMAAWDAKYLYLGAKVVDQRYVQDASGANLFLGDSLEVLMDTNVSADYYLRSLSVDDYQVGISPGKGSPGDHPEAYLWFPSSKEGSLSKVKIAAKSTSDGYIVEAAIPWSTFGITPASGQHYGFAFSISDNDNQDKDVQQTMVSNASKRTLTDPTTWGDLTLVNP